MTHCAPADSASPGLFDLHSHLGAEGYPLLKATTDENSFVKTSNIAPYLRSVDGINGHDESLKLTVGGGVTSSIILPGSANQMGGSQVVSSPKHDIMKLIARSRPSVCDQAPLDEGQQPAE